MVSVRAGRRRSWRPITGAAVILCLCGCAPEHAGPSSAEARTSNASARAAPATPAALETPAGVVAAFIRDRMLRASVVMAAPGSLNRGEPGVATLRVAPSTVPRAVLEQELRSRLERAGHGASATLPVAPRLVATMTADQDCDIQLSNPPEEREVAFGERTTWEWTVRPTRSTGASVALTVTLVAPIVVDGHETRHEVGAYHTQVAVQVTYRDRLDDTLAPVGGVWTVLTAAAMSLVVAGAWTLRSRRRRSAP